MRVNSKKNGLKEGFWMVALESGGISDDLPIELWILFKVFDETFKGKSYDNYT